MLVLSRKQGEEIIIDGHITVKVVGTGGNRVRLAIDAPPHVRILRSELSFGQHGFDESAVIEPPPLTESPSMEDFLVGI